MFGIHLTKEGRIKDRFRQRQRYAYLVEEDLGLQRELHRNLSFAQRAVALGKDDEALYERLFNRPAPEQLRRVLDAELLLWMHLRDVLADFARRDILPDGYRKETTALQAYVADLCALTTLARTAFVRPLTTREQRQLSAILARRG
jgi:hypothetical protein